MDFIYHWFYEIPCDKSPEIFVMHVRDIWFKVILYEKYSYDNELIYNSLAWKYFEMIGNTMDK